MTRNIITVTDTDVSPKISTAVIAQDKIGLAVNPDKK